MRIQQPKDKLFVALDGMNAKKAIYFIDRLGSTVGGFKIGLELINMQEAGIVAKYLLKKGYRIFWDGKWDDSPNTIKGAARAILDWNVTMFTVMAASGIKAMQTAVANSGEALVLAVTVLTTLEEDETVLIFGASSKATVSRLARMAKGAGCDGFVCPPHQLSYLSQLNLDRMMRVTPSIRPTGTSGDDHALTMTPTEAIRNHADILVVGRPITAPYSGTPEEAVERIVAEITSALG